MLNSYLTVETADDIYLFRRLDEIEGELQDFHISGYKCNLLHIERNEIYAELKKRCVNR